MNDTLRAIVRMLDDAAPELKVAAAQVLGELRAEEAGVVQALGTRLDRDEPYLWSFVMEALARIGTEPAITLLLQQLGEGGVRSEKARQVLLRSGLHGGKAIAEHFDRASLELQLHLLEALGRAPQKEGLAVLQRSLLSRNHALVAKAAEVLRATGAQLAEAQRKALSDGLRKALGKDTIVEPESIAAVLQVLRTLEGDAARTTLWAFAGAKHPTTVRRAALHALQKLELTPVQADALVGFLDEDDLQLVHAALDLLRDIRELGAGARAKLKKLLLDSREERRLYALRLLRCFQNLDSAKLAIEHLHSQNPDFRAAAAEALGANPTALEMLLKGFVSEKSVEKARAYAPPLLALKAEFKDKHVGMLVERAAKLLVAGDAGGDVALAVLVGVKPEEGVSDLADRAARLRKAKRVQDALAILLKLAHAAAIPHDVRYQLAVSRLLADSADRSRNGTVENGDATMGYFALLVREGFPLLEKLKKDVQVSSDLILKLGSHFASAVGPERRFGTECLKLVADRHSRGKVGEEARHLLRTTGA